MACYWVIAVPFDVPPGGSHSHERERTYQSLRTATEEQTDHCVNYKVNPPPRPPPTYRKWVGRSRCAAGGEGWVRCASACLDSWLVRSTALLACAACGGG